MDHLSTAMVTVAVILAVVAFGRAAIRARTGEPVVGLIIGSLLLVAMAAIMPRLAEGLFQLDSLVEKPLPAPPVKDSAPPGFDVDWAAAAAWLVPVGITAGVVALVALVVGGLVLVLARVRAKRDRAIEHAISSGWKAARARDQQVLDTWSRYDTDLDLLLRFPSMRDLSNPATADAVRAMGVLQDTRPPADASCPGDFHVRHPYAEAARVAEQTLNRAIHQARRHGADTFTVRERAAITQARKLLGTVLAESTPLPERSLAYQHVIRLLQGIIVIPETATTAIEEKLQLAIAR